MRQAPGRGSLKAAIRLCVLAIFVAPALTACGGVFSGVSDFISTKTKFSSREYGAAASPRMTNSKHTRKGGGRYQVGKPYKIAGNWYTPKHDPRYDKTGAASWYGPNFHGRQTANGEIFDQNAISAAHPTLPLPSYVRVTNLENNRSILVRVNDRGPFVRDREIDLSKRTADLLGYLHKGTARVRVKYVGKAPLEGDDTRMLMASYNSPTRMERSQTSDTRIALADAPKPSGFNFPNLFNVAPQVKPLTSVTSPTASLGNVSVTAQGFNIVNRVSVGADGLGPLFYAPEGFDGAKTGHAVNNAFAAARAMADRTPDLEAWRKAIDADARKVHLELGVFSDTQNAQNVTEAFALIGAVDRTEISLSGTPAIRLTLTHLKPGVTRRDALERAHTLGLEDVILY